MTPEQIEQALAEHERVSGYRDLRKHCTCGWMSPNRAGISAHRAHVAQMLASLMPQATERTEYTDMCSGGRGPICLDADDAYQAAADKRIHDDCADVRVVRRVVTSYAPVVGPWEACDE